MSRHLEARLVCSSPSLPPPQPWLALLLLAACSDNVSAIPQPDAGPTAPLPSVTATVAPGSEDAAPAPKPTTTDAGDDSGATTVSEYKTTVSGSNDPADVYFPSIKEKDSMPVVVLAQGAKVDKKHYSRIAKSVALSGFVVIVPNHKRTVFIDTNFYPEASSVLAAFTHVVAEAKRSGAPIEGLVDTSKFAVLGHSFGGALGVNMLGGTCSIPFCSPPYTVPKELKAGVFYGTSLKPPFGEIPATTNAGRGIALIQGSLDGKNATADARTTFDKIATAPRAYVLVSGANHYGINDTNNPMGADADANTNTLSQLESTETVGRWAGAFLRAAVLGDAAAKAQFSQDPSIVSEF